MKQLATLNPYLWKYKYYIIFGTLFVTISNVFGVIPAQLVRHAFDLVKDTINLYFLFKGFENQSIVKELFATNVLFYGFLIVLMALLRGIFLFLTRQTIIVMSRHIEYDQKNDIYQHYQSLPLSFYKRNNTGDLMARISEDVSKVRMYTGPALMYGINLIVVIILVVTYMLTVNVTLTLYVLTPLPLLALSIYYVNNLINRYSEQIQKSLSNLSTFVQEAFSGIRVIKAYSRQQDSSARFREESLSYRQKSLRLSHLTAIFYPLILAMIGASTILTIYAGGVEVMNGNITTGNIAEFVIYVNMLTWPVTSLGWVTSIIQRAAASQQRINEFLAVKNDIVSDKNLTTVIAGEITFQHVSFTYPDTGIKALEDISFSIKKGETVAILGATGSGKSTIANLICRMYDTTSGTILVDNLPIQDYEPSYLRSNISVVPQDVFLFSDTIRNNIAFGFDEIPNEETIIKAAQQAHLHHNIVEFPKGYETMLGERGITLSGGQKQRLSIARAIILSPKILILDDCLSAVDTHTEHTILDNLKQVMQNKTAIIISHRVSSAKLADKIILLENGKIIQQGTHAQLIEQAGAYRDLYEKQLNVEEVMTEENNTTKD